LASNP
jgi:hypothetical protein